MTKFTVVYRRDETGWWVAQVREAPAAITQGRTLAEARRRIREALALAVDSDAVARRASLIDDVRLPRTVRRALRAVSVSRTRLERERDRLSQANDAALSELIGRLKLSLRDAGELLGLSHQRIQQLKVLSLVGALRGTGLRESVRERRSAPRTV